MPKKGPSASEPHIDGDPGPLDGNRRFAADQAYDELKRRILDNQLPARTQALEAELADELGMSRTPVREALVRAGITIEEERTRRGWTASSASRRATARTPSTGR